MKKVTTHASSGGVMACVNDTSSYVLELNAAYCRAADVSELIVWERLSQLTHINA